MPWPNPVDVLADAWGICVPVGPPRAGTRRTTWRVGESLWLAAAGGPDADRLRREAELLAVAAPIAHDARIVLPQISRTREGTAALFLDDCAWRLCSHVDGDPVDPRQAGIWRGVGSFVARLDAALAAVPLDLAVCSDGVVAAGFEHRRRFCRDLWVPASSSSEEFAVLERATTWLDGRLEALASLPVQLTHGDCHTPNLLARASPRIDGAIDLEFAAIDPPVVELASPAANLVIDSGARELRAQLRALWTSWRRAGGDADFEALETALLLTRLRFYWLTRDRFVADAARAGICVAFIGLVLDVVDGAKDRADFAQLSRPRGQA